MIEVATADVFAIRKPIWSSKPATARAVHQRFCAVMKRAVAKGYRPTNPAGDAITAALPHNGNALRQDKALPHGEVAAAVAEVTRLEVPCRCPAGARVPGPDRDTLERGSGRERATRSSMMSGPFPPAA